MVIAAKLLKVELIRALKKKKLVGKCVFLPKNRPSDENLKNFSIFSKKSLQKFHKIEYNHYCDKSLFFVVLVSEVETVEYYL